MDDLEQQVRAFVHERLPWLPLDMDLHTDVVRAGKIDGDDVSELIEEFSERFVVQMDEYRWYYHHGSEGCNPLWLIFPPLWMRKHIPIRLADLVESARARKWCVVYPSDSRPARE